MSLDQFIKILPKIVSVIQSVELEENIIMLENNIAVLKEQRENAKFKLAKYKTRYLEFNTSLENFQLQVNKLVENVNEAMNVAKNVNSSYFYAVQAKKRNPFFRDDKK